MAFENEDDICACLLDAQRPNLDNLTRTRILLLSFSPIPVQLFNKFIPKLASSSAILKEMRINIQNSYSVYFGHHAHFTSFVRYDK